MARPKRPARGLDTRQTWTRCRIPVNEPIPTSLGLRTKEWTSRLAFLSECAGFDSSKCGRSIEDPESVVFIMYWKNEESLQAFISSPALPRFLQIFFGVNSLQQAPPFAFLTLAPQALLFGETIRVFTLTYAHPVPPEDRHLGNGGRGVDYSLVYFGHRVHTTWLKQPERLDNGELVDLAMIIRGRNSPWDTRPIVEECRPSKNPLVRIGWDGETERITPLSVERVQWNLRPPDEEIEAHRDQNLRDDAEYMATHSDLDEAEFDDDYLLEEQLVTEMEYSLKYHARSDPSAGGISIV